MKKRRLETTHCHCKKASKFSYQNLPGKINFKQHHLLQQQAALIVCRASSAALDASTQTLLECVTGWQQAHKCSKGERERERDSMKRH